MKLLHTGDWHVGKVLKGVPRLDEQRAVLGELVEIARAEAVDVVLVAGDVFESAAPTPEAQTLAWSTLLALRALGAEVLVIAGNHDPAESFEALRPVFAAAGVHVLGRPARPGDGGLIELGVGAGETLRVARLPFVSQRGVVRAEQLLELDGAEMAQAYGGRMRAVLAALTASFTSDAVNVVLAHTMVRGGTLGGGEREAQSIFDYGVESTSFPPSASYVALGHLHRRQLVPGPCPIWYPGSPIAVDFGEEAATPGVLVVEVAAGRPALVREHVLTQARPLRTATGTLAELRDQAGPLAAAGALVRVVVTEPSRPGLAEEVRAIVADAIDIRVAPPEPADGAPSATTTAAGAAPRAPGELFAAFLAEQNVADPRLHALFARLLDTVTSSAEAR